MISNNSSSSSTTTLGGNLKERLTASVILGAVGDAIGYKNGSWEFNFSGETIHAELKHYYGSLAGIDVKGWRVSDDTVMHLASLRALINWMEEARKATNSDKTLVYKFDENDSESCAKFMTDYVHPLMREMSKEYIICWDDMGGRAPGPTCGKGVRFLESRGVEKWETYPYDKRGGGCGGSMRAMSIGAALSGVERRDMLIACSVESGRLTHNHPNGFLGALVSALFTAYAIEQTIPVPQWGVYFLYDVMPRTRAYLEKVAKRDWEEMKDEITKFEEKIAQYLSERDILLSEVDFKNSNKLNSLQAKFPKKYGIAERDAYYKKWSFAGWAGASGDDSCIIAYDALLCAGPNNYETMMLNSALHAGDSDSTGTIAAAWYGAIYGFNNVFKSNWDNIEKKNEMIQISEDLYKLYY